MGNFPSYGKTTWETGLNSLCSCFCAPVLLPPVVLLQTPGFLGDGHPHCVGLGYSDLRPINQLVQGMLHSDWPAKPKPGSEGWGLVGA